MVSALRRPIETRLSHRTEGRCPQVAHVKRKKGPKPDCVRVDYRAIFPSAWLFFAGVVGSHLLCVCVRGKFKKSRVEGTFYHLTMRCFIIGLKRSTHAPDLFRPLLLFLLVFCRDPKLTNAPLCVCWLFPQDRPRPLQPRPPPTPPPPPATQTAVHVSLGFLVFLCDRIVKSGQLEGQSGTFHSLNHILKPVSRASVSLLWN